MKIIISVEIKGNRGVVQKNGGNEARGDVIGR